MKEFISLFTTFARIGGLTFGGGYAMLPMLQKEVVENKHWATEEELMDYYAIGQCTPGIIAINTATFIGYKTKGILGGIIATLGVITPALFIITIITAFLQNIIDYPIIKSALAGIRVCVCVLVFHSVTGLCKKAVKDVIGLVTFISVLILSLFTNTPTALTIFATGVIGIFIKSKEEKES